MKISKRLRKDPWMSKSIEKSYENDLVGLFKDVQPKITELLERRVKQMETAWSKVKQLATGRADTAGFTYELELIIEDGILKVGRVIINDAVRQSYRGGAMRANQFLHIKLGDVEIDPDVIKILDERNYAALKGVTDEMEKQIKEILTDGVLKGQSIGDMSRDIRDTVENIGIQRARVIARTETIYAINQAAIATYKEHHVKEVEWLAAQDDRICEECMERDGKTYPINNPPDIPAHPNCRCAVLPVIEEV